jgi:hypothetical protein
MADHAPAQEPVSSKALRVISISLGLVTFLFIVSVIVFGIVIHRGDGEESVVPEADQPIPRETIRFEEMATPTIRTPLSQRGTTRLRKVIVQFGPGEEGLRVAVDNYDNPVRRGGMGVAARTNTDATILDNFEFLTLNRPDDCAEGCVYTFWITMGLTFQDNHPDAYLVVYAGDGSEGRVDDIDTLPAEVAR